MTHDALVQFAAKKLGVKVRPVYRQEAVPFNHVYPDLTNTAVPSTLPEIKVLAYYVIEETESRFDLTSWEIMGKGLEVADHTYRFDLCNRRGWRFWKKQGMSVHATQPSTINVLIDNITDIPLAFWEAWYELENKEAA